MKKLFSKHSKLFGFIFGLILSVSLVAGGAMAAGTFAPTTMTTVTGTITIANPVIPNDYIYSFSSPNVTFTSATFAPNVSISIDSQSITITDSGHPIVTGISVIILTPPTGLTGVTLTPIETVGNSLTGQYVAFKLRLTADAISSPTTIDLSTMVIQITPTHN